MKKKQKKVLCFTVVIVSVPTVEGRCGSWKCFRRNVRREVNQKSSAYTSFLSPTIGTHQREITRGRERLGKKQNFLTGKPLISQAKKCLRFFFLLIWVRKTGKTILKTLKCFQLSATDFLTAANCQTLWGGGSSFRYASDYDDCFTQVRYLWLVQFIIFCSRGERKDNIMLDK